MPDGSSPADKPVGGTEHAAGRKAQVVTEAAEPVRPRRRRLTRHGLMIAGLLAVLVGGGWMWLSGGRYVTTDNAYLGARTVLVAPRVTGPVTTVAITEGQIVEPGTLLFTIDDGPYRTAVDAAHSAVEAARLDLEALRQDYRKTLADIEVEQRQVEYWRHEVERTANLVARSAASQADLDRERLELSTAEARVAALQQEAQAALARLGGDPDLPLEAYPGYLAAKARLDAAERDLADTEVRASIAGITTQTDQIVPGRYLSAGTTALAIVSLTDVWVDANPKETDLAGLAEGQHAAVTIDAYPDLVLDGIVETISPGTGSQFALLPAQNASGNWVKVVQRVPVRIRIEAGADMPPLRAGMSAGVAIDTGRERSLADLL